MADTPPYDPSVIFADDDPGGQPHQPPKQQIRVLLNWIIASLGGVAVVKATKALLDADLAHAAGTPATVYADSTPANNGTYIKIGASGTGSWSQTFSSADFSDLASRLAACFPTLTGGQTSINDLVEYNIAETEVTTGHNTQYLDRAVDDTPEENTIFGIEPDGVTISQPRMYYPGGSLVWAGFSNYSYRVTNDIGETVAGEVINPDGSVTVYSPEPPAASYSEIDAQVKATADRLRAKRLWPQGARPVWQLNGFIGYGESLETGHGSLPTLSRTAFLDMPGDVASNLKMVGNSIHCAGAGATTTWTPAGGSNVLNDLVATAMEFSTGNIYTNADAALLNMDTNTAKGEAPLIGALRTWRRLHLRHLGLGSDPNHQWVAQDLSISGQTIANLKKGAGANYYNRVITAVTAAKALADAAGKSYGVVAIHYSQGANDYGVGITKAGWKADTAQLFADLRADIMAITGQEDPPWIFLQQTSAGWVRDNVFLQISMAQWELGMEVPGVVLVGPWHQVTNRSDGHLDANGSRWKGTLAGHAMFRAITLGEGVIPTMPVGVEVDGRKLRVRVATSNGAALTTGTVYSVSGALSLDNFGCALTDGAGAVTLTSPTITSAATAEWDMSRDVDTASAKFWGGPQTTFFGCCALCDSDAFETFDDYEYRPGGDYGMPTNKNIAGLPDEPYGGPDSLRNFMVLSYLPVGWTSSAWE